jgi:hypothetical protein
MSNKTTDDSHDTPELHSRRMHLQKQKSDSLGVMLLSQEARHHRILREESPHARTICGNCGMQRSCADCQWQLKHYGPLMHESPIKARPHPSTSPLRSRDLLDWQVTCQNSPGVHASQPANQWAARIKSLTNRQIYHAFLHVPPGSNTSSFPPPEMRLREFLGLLSHHGILPAIVSDEQAHHCFRVCGGGGTQKLSYENFERAMATLCGMLQALDEPVPARNTKQLTLTEEWAHSSSPAGPGVPSSDVHVQGSRRKELALSQAQIVHRKMHTDLMCRRRGHTSSTIASRLREAFTDKQSYRTLYEDMLEENRNLAEELMIAESQLSHQQHRVHADPDECERLSAALAQAKQQAQAHEHQLVQARNEAYTTAKAQAHELAQAHAREKAQADIASSLQAQVNEYKDALARFSESPQSRHEHEARRVSSVHDVSRERDAPERARLEIENIHLKQKLDEVSAIAAMRMRETEGVKHENDVLRARLAALTGEQHANKVTLAMKEICGFLLCVVVQVRPLCLCIHP